MSDWSDAAWKDARFTVRAMVLNGKIYTAEGEPICDADGERDEHGQWCCMRPKGHDGQHKDGRDVEWV